jgi:hypothetical protein
MGQQQATLGKLLETQANCNQLLKKGFKTGQQRVECNNNASALEKAAGEYATEAKDENDPANKVFWYSLAATASWGSRRPESSENAVTYADQATNICEKSTGIQPGDCAYMYAVPVFISSDNAAIKFYELKKEAKSATEGKPIGDRKKAEQKVYLSTKESDITQIETLSSDILLAWMEFQGSWGDICKVKDTHQDLIDELAKKQKTIVENLKQIHDKALTLPIMPENADWIKYNLCRKGEIKKNNINDLIEKLQADKQEILLAKPKTKFLPEKTADENMPLFRRTMVHTFCAWQYAETRNKDKSKKCAKKNQ